MDGTDAATLLRAERIPTEATRLVGSATEQSLLLRITGSVAVHLHCPQHNVFMRVLGRRPFYDIDFWGRDRDHQRIDAFFQAHGYLADPAAHGLREWGIKRQIFAHPETGIKIDVFMDTLVMAHSIKFADRLELANPCISLADLVLSKLNLALLHESVQRPGLDPELAARVRMQIETLRAHLAAAPKSRRWKLRAKVGTRKRWYEQVEEVS
jgi:hypothetical protein